MVAAKKMFFFCGKLQKKQAILQYPPPPTIFYFQCKLYTFIRTTKQLKFAFIFSRPEIPNIFKEKVAAKHREQKKKGETNPFIHSFL